MHNHSHNTNSRILALDACTRGGSAGNPRTVTPLQNAHYSVTVLDAQVRPAIKRYHVEVVSMQAELAVELAPGDFCGNGPITLRVEGALPHYTYRWSTGETTSEIHMLALVLPVVTVHAECAPGDHITLLMPEMGIVGRAQLEAILPSTLDTRSWDYRAQGDYAHYPLTGFFAHESAEVWDLYFSSSKEPVGATYNHPVLNNCFKQVNEIDQYEYDFDLNNNNILDMHLDEEYNCLIYLYKEKLDLYEEKYYPTDQNLLNITATSFLYSTLQSKDKYGKLQ